MSSSPHNAPAAEAEPGSDFSAEGIEQLRQMLEDSGALEVVEALVSEVDDTRPGVALALQQGDAKALRLRAHSFKGSAGLLQATALAGDFGQVEELFAVGQFDAAAGRLPGLLARYEALLLRARQAFPV